MRGNSSGSGMPLVPAAFATLSQRGAIQTAAQQEQDSRISWRQVYDVDPTSVFMWLLGVLVTAWATWYSAKEHREQLAVHLAAQPQAKLQQATQHTANTSQVGVSADAGDSPAAGEPGEGGGYKGQCSVGLVVGALVLSSVLLLALFFMLRGGVPIVWLLIPLFALGAAGAQARIVWLPLLRKVSSPVLDRHAGHWHPKLAVITVRVVIAAALGAAVSGVWIALRHTPAVYLFQNLLGALVCANLLVRLQLHELRALSALLAAFFVYDVFFVFLTPFVFGGDSVMVAVATAGQPEPVANPACFCRLNPGAEECGEGERMPILLTLPRMGWGGGEALLGLGDIVLPGLLLSLLARYDTEGFHSLRRGKYWICGMIGYALGLAAANAAVVISGEGQPALLYIVPCVIAASLLRAWFMQEVPLVWYGPIGTVPDAESVQLIASSNPSTAMPPARTMQRSVQHDTLNPMGQGSPDHTGMQLQLAESGTGRMDPAQGKHTTKGRRKKPHEVESASLLSHPSP